MSFLSEYSRLIYIDVDSGFISSQVALLIFGISVFSSEGVEQCKKWSGNMTQQIDLAFNIFFMVYFFIRVSWPNVSSLHFSRCILISCCNGSHIYQHKLVYFITNSFDVNVMMLKQFDGIEYLMTCKYKNCYDLMLTVLDEYAWMKLSNQLQRIQNFQKKISQLRKFFIDL